MLRPLAACILGAGKKEVVTRLVRAPTVHLSCGLRSQHALFRSMCAGRKGSVDPEHGAQWPVLDMKDDLIDDEGPLGRIMTEARMREQVAQSLDIQVLHRLQVTSDSKDIPQPLNSVEYTSMSKIHSSVALNFLSISTEKSTSNSVGTKEEVPASGADSDFPIATVVPHSIMDFDKQRLYMKVSVKESLEYAPACNTLVETLRESIEAIGSINTDDAEAVGVFASSVVKKRRKKMNKHKYKKRMKRDRGRL